MKKILIVEDEPTQREVLHDIFEMHDWKAFMAENGRQALKIFRKEKDIGTVVTDYVMPHMTGQDLFYELKKIRPSTQIFCLSGWVPENDAISKMEKDGLAGFMLKPVSIEHLLEVVK